MYITKVRGRVYTLNNACRQCSLPCVRQQAARHINRRRVHRRIDQRILPWYFATVAVAVAVALPHAPIRVGHVADLAAGCSQGSRSSVLGRFPSRLLLQERERSCRRQQVASRLQRRRMVQRRRCTRLCGSLRSSGSDKFGHEHAVVQNVARRHARHDQHGLQRQPCLLRLLCRVHVLLRRSLVLG